MSGVGRFTPPSSVYRVGKLTMETLRDKVVLEHMRDDGEGFVVAEGEEEVQTNLPSMPRKLFITDDGLLFAYSTYQTGYLHTLDYGYGFYSDARVANVFHLPLSTGGTARIFVSRDNVVQMSGSSATTVGVDKGGTCAVWHADRLFTGKNSRICYSKERNPLVWTESRFEGGSMQLPDGVGKVHTLVSHKGFLWAFCQRGIVKMNTFGDALSFCQSVLPYAGGNMVEYSAALCENQFVFLTQTSLVIFDGNKYEEYDGLPLEEIDFTQEVQSGCFKGEYFVVAVSKTAQPCVYLFHPKKRRHRELKIGAISLVAGQEGYFLRDDKLYRLTPKGFSYMGNVLSTVKIPPTAMGMKGGKKRAHTLQIVGEGSFYATVSGEKGSISRAVSANEPKRIAQSVYGEKFSFEIIALNQTSQIQEVILSCEEVEE